MGEGLSQNEIDALLAGVDESDLSSEGGGEEGAAYKEPSERPTASKSEMEDLNEFLNEALSSGFSVLSEMTESEISISQIKSNLKDSDKILSSLKGKVITISQELKGDLNGQITFILQEEGALKLVEKMLDQEETVLSEIALSTLGENFNQFLNTVYTWIEKTYRKSVEGDVPKVNIVENPVDLELPSKQSVDVDFYVRMDDTDIPIKLILPVTVSKEMINFVLKGSKEAAAAQEAQAREKKARAKQVNARPVQFSRLEEGAGKMPLGNIEILLDVSMQVTVELGRTKMRIREILGLGDGSIIELQKLAGEPVDILVNGKLIAKGEVVVIDEYFGVRITEIISPSEMLNIMGAKEEF
jgi:flagellar motor switch protein FliN/FliY